MPLVPFFLAYVRDKNIVTTMANLNTLPVEVILMIFDCLEHNLMLSSVSLVSKRLCTIAQPRLFREITLSSSIILPSLLLL
jgi:hypothetical protein